MHPTPPGGCPQTRQCGSVRTTRAACTHQQCRNVIVWPVSEAHCLPTLLRLALGRLPCLPWLLSLALPALLHPLTGFPVYKGGGGGALILRVCSSGLLSAHRSSAHSTGAVRTSSQSSCSAVSGFKMKEGLGALVGPGVCGQWHSRYGTSCRLGRGKPSPSWRDRVAALPTGLALGTLHTGATGFTVKGEWAG